MKLHRLIPVLASVALLSGMGTSFSQLITTDSKTAPVNVEQGSSTTLNTASSLVAFDPTNRESVGMSFEAASNYDLTGISVQVDSASSFSSSSFSLSIYQTTSASEIPTSGTLLETQTNFFAQSSPDNTDFLTFSLPASSPVAVKSGDFYAYVLTAPSLSGDLILDSTTSDTLHSELFESAMVPGSPALGSAQANPIEFFVDGDSEAAAPEPSVYQLLVAGVLGLLFFVRRRRSLVG